MGEIMRPIPFSDLMEWTLEEYQDRGTVFGISKSKFYKNASGTKFEMFGDTITSPVGPAAGPHAQLAQNIVASYLAGARYMELKTVQEMDGEALRNAVPRPCINAEDEAYNVEWSTEFTVPEAFNEYVKGWFATHVLAKEFGISDERDFIFNISAGYSYEGITGKKVDTFITDMNDASSTPIWKECISYLENNIDKFENFTKEDIAKIRPAVAPSITLSTLHGCPPAEIEKIAMHFLTVKKVHTYIKCNPTLLGYEFARKTLDEMGYDYVQFTDHHFNNDLQYADGISMFKRLMAVAKEQNLSFGVKITNTFPVLIKNNELPGEEMYMSGRSLYPLSIAVANLLTQEFDGQMPISYSGGADAFNIEGLIDAGIQPVTVATTLLKPGGYERFNQLATLSEKALKPKFAGVDKAKMKALAEDSVVNARHLKSARLTDSVKTDTTLPLFDCAKSPCSEGGCPINQQIPEYVNLVNAGKFDEAFKIIAIDNALPAATGTICDHNCQNKCVRNNYEDAVQIRTSKMKAVSNAQDNFIKNMSVTDIKTDSKVVIVGAGPAGIAASYFLRRNGVDVTVLEKNDSPYGIPKYVIPSFRIPQIMMDRDYNMAVKAGVNFKFGVDPNYTVQDLQKDYDYVILATGAWKEGRSPVKEGGDNIIDALAFLQESKEKDLKLDLGKRVAIIGAGDVAMDCSRVAVRTPGVEEAVVVYRRTREFMPALPEEIDDALEDGVKVMELLAPVSYDGKTLTVEVQELTNDIDASGRRTVKGTGATKTLEFDTVIGAVGARVDTSLFEKNDIALNEWSMPAVSSTNQSSIHNVYIAGDCKAGASTLVKAIADAKAITQDILAKVGLAHDFVRVDVNQAEADIYARRGVLKDIEETNRCLTCNQICEICTEVCPNRANVFIKISEPTLMDSHQILHVDGMCNECGNCGTFCPHTGNPYLDKLTLFWTKEDFDDSSNTGFLPVSDKSFRVRLADGKVVDYTVGDKGVIPTELERMIHTVCNDYSYYLVKPVM